MNKIEKLAQIMKDSSNIVFFGGAGVSTESGLKDFRSKDGLYHEKYDYPPEEILSHHFFLNYKPNITHYVLARLEEKGLLKAIITQNIDGFHQRAGSKNVLELHGSIHRNYCMKCNKFYDAEYVFSKENIPKCSCGGIIKPDVVLYEESLETEILKKAIKEISKADTLIIGGTSLNVYPAAGLINYFQGKNLILINKEKTPYDSKCNLVIYDSIGKVMEALDEEIGNTQKYTRKDD